jgi:hypothetical protein
MEGAGVPVPVFPVHPVITAAAMVMARRTRARCIPLVIGADEDHDTIKVLWNLKF